MATPCVFETYIDLNLDQLLAVIRERLADVAHRLHFGPVPGDLGLDQAAALIAECAEQQVPDHLADVHRQLGYAARDLGTVAGRQAQGDDQTAAGFLRSAALHLDQAERVRVSAEWHHVDPLDRIGADVAEIRQYVVQTLAPALGWSGVPSGPYTLEMAGKTVVGLGEGYAAAEEETPDTARGRVARSRCYKIRQHLTSAGALLASAHFKVPAGVSDDEIAGRVHFATGLVRASARLQQPTEQHGGNPA